MKSFRLQSASGVHRHGTGLRVGLFGLLGQGNIGNDASLEAVLRYLRRSHPEAALDAMATGPARLKARYDLDSNPLYWHSEREARSRGPVAVALKFLGKVVDTWRIARWTARHDVVIVPGMGVLEATVPIRPWETPYTLFVLCVTARIARTRVAFVDVGASLVKARATRWLLDTAARLAFYRSYRDGASREFMRSRGLAASGDHVFPDLVFALPNPVLHPVDPTLVGVGLMGYHGTNDDDRRHADQIHATYVAKMKQFVRWLLDNDRRVRLLVGDNNDRDVVQEILADARSARPDREGWIVAKDVTSFCELTEAIGPVHSVVATRFHNVLCALKLGKPTVSIGYAPKNAAIMADAGLGEYCQWASSLDLRRLIEQFTDLEERSGELTPAIVERSAANARMLDAQFAELSSVVLTA